MAEAMRIRANEAGGVTTVRVLMFHPMESGLRKDAVGMTVPAHHITTVEATHNGKTVLLANWSGSVSQDPFLLFKFKGAAKGDKVAIRWVDNKGGTETREATVA